MATAARPTFPSVSGDEVVRKLTTLLTVGVATCAASPTVFSTLSAPCDSERTSMPDASSASRVFSCTRAPHTVCSLASRGVSFRESYVPPHAPRSM